MGAVIDVVEQIKRGNQLAIHGIVETVPAPNQFTCEALSGLGNGKFTGATGNPWYVFVVRDVGGAGAAPQGELQPITAYVSATGLFTHTAFTIALAQGDEIVLLHPALAAAMPLGGTNQGLCYYGIVTNIPVANQCDVPTLAGMGVGKFMSAANPYELFVLRDNAGTGIAPQGEMQEITGYTNAGRFTHNAFTVPLVAGDEVLVIHPALAAILDIVALLVVPAADAVTNAYERDVIGNKEDSALAVVGTTASLMRYIKALVDLINMMVGVLELNETGGTVTTDGNEQTLYYNNAPAGSFKPLVLQLDCTNMAAGDTVVVRTYYRIAPGGNLILQDETTLSDDMDPDLVSITLLPNRYGIRVTIQETAGAHNDFNWEVLYEN